MPSSKRPRRKANQARSRRTVELLLEAAARVLIKRGYSLASTNRIAEAAGVSVGTLYEYFADKEAVFDALIQREIEALVAAIRYADLRADASLGGVTRKCPPSAALPPWLRRSAGLGGPAPICALEGSASGLAAGVSAWSAHGPRSSPSSAS